MIDVIVPIFQMVSWEYHSWGDLPNNTANWENDRLVSLIVMRNPIDRFLAGGKCGLYHNSLGGVPDGPRTPEEQALFWNYTKDPCAHNFALRILSQYSPDVHNLEKHEVDFLEFVKEQNQNNTNETTNTTITKDDYEEYLLQRDLDSAKAYLRRMTIIIDQDCLIESVIAVGKLLNLPPFPILEAQRKTAMGTRHDTARKRIGNDTLYEYIQERFKYDIELYRWSKSQSIVKCNATYKQ